MTLLYLGPPRPDFEQFLNSCGFPVVRIENKLVLADLVAWRLEFILSYGYRYRLAEDIIAAFPNRIINLHISFLPWNRGADPNVWSFLENTPKGVSIHQIDSGIDTGPILFQQEVPWDSGDTLKTTYNRLSQTIEALCRDHWADLFSGKIVPQPQQAGGSCHRRRDIERVRSLLTKGWDTPVIELLGKGVSCDTVPIDPPEIGRN